MKNLSEKMANLGRGGGRSKSERKRRAVQENGRMGGRPSRIPALEEAIKQRDEEVVRLKRELAAVNEKLAKIAASGDPEPGTRIDATGITVKRQGLTPGKLTTPAETLPRYRFGRLVDE